jgi:universal stress protein A
MLRFRKILCPVDFDAASLQALKLASELAKESGATLHLLHIVVLPPAPEVALPFGRMEEAARGRLEKLIRQHTDRGTHCEVRVMMGDAAAEVLLAAKRTRADLIVMATHGRTGLRRLMLGSVAERVVREAPCPVLSLSPAVKGRRRPAQSSPKRH